MLGCQKTTAMSKVQNDAHGANANKEKLIFTSAQALYAS